MIAEIENAMLSRLTSAKVLRLLGYTVKTVDSLGGEFDDEAALKKAVNLVPGIWVTFMGEEKAADQGYGSHKMKATFRVVVAAINKRNQAATRHGSGTDVGTYQMAQDARTLLAGQTFGMDIGYLEPVRIRTFPAVEKAMPGLSVMAVEFTTTYTATDAPDQPGARIGADVPRDKGLPEAMAIGAGITDFRTTHADWVPPFNLSDTVSLET
ncbi:phage protein Gp37 [Magnetospirillum fulvum]|uniref:Uncharacterized protein n=1 Tax=Magnetospirillum fulvum MGU-K5 TaxID=1316936 RepID=S9TF44_MAGFU|nr:phage protein Gp37 [Magnetospirillum fulvum]EPY00881.1 hypothetical protein K678_13975 [Magnetospirillum fulvum MGU-K5]